MASAKLRKDGVCARNTIFDSEKSVRQGWQVRNRRGGYRGSPSRTTVRPFSLLLLGLVATNLGRVVTGEVVGSATAAELDQDTLNQHGNNYSQNLRAGIRRRLPTITTGTVGESYDVTEHTGDKAEGGMSEEQATTLSEEMSAVPPVWDSTLCMHHWGTPGLQTERDPNGYLIYVNGREQLGGNKYLVSDGLFAAKTLGRTFVEYPVKDARVWTFGGSTLGLGAYWDMDELCMYHRMLDLKTFRAMVADGIIPADSIQTVRSLGYEFMMSGVHTEDQVQKIFKPYESANVIVMESTWKSAIDREALFFLRPNPFYMGVVRMLLEQQKEWEVGNFLAVQWRTETATGNITECYEELKGVINTQLVDLGLGPHQVLFNTDLYGQTSGTYMQYQKNRARDVIALINADYPAAFDNRLHQFIEEMEDSGVRAFVSGLAVASARAMVASSLNDHDTGDIPEAQRCQKAYSGYIHLVREWRDEFTQQPKESSIRMWPFEPQN